MKKIFLAIISLAIITFNTCDENPVNGDNVTPGRRDYVWELDSLQKISPNYYSEIWGTSMDNLWLATDSYDLDKNLLHFNGEEWNKVSTIPSPVQALSLFGLDETLAWIGGPYGDFWKYNGQTFEFFKSYHLQEFLLTYISDIWGNRANNLYAVGSVASLDNQHLYAFIMLFDGVEWRYLVNPSREEQFLKVMSGSNINSDLLVLSNYDDPSHGDIYRLYRYNSGNFQLLLNNSENPSDIPWF